VIFASGGSVVPMPAVRTDLHSPTQSSRLQKWSKFLGDKT
jgi:hypothetical protein